MFKDCGVQKRLDMCLTVRCLQDTAEHWGISWKGWGTQWFTEEMSFVFLTWHINTEANSDFVLCQHKMDSTARNIFISCEWSSTCQSSIEHISAFKVMSECEWKLIHLNVFNNHLISFLNTWAILNKNMTLSRAPASVRTEQTFYKPEHQMQQLLRLC